MSSEFIQPSRSLWIPFLHLKEELLSALGDSGRIEIYIGVTATGGGKRNQFAILLQRGDRQTLLTDFGDYVIS